MIISKKLIYEYLSLENRLQQMKLWSMRKAKETITVPNKFIFTRFKVWGIAQMGFLICWNWHTSGDKNGPVGVISRYNYQG